MRHMRQIILVFLLLGVGTVMAAVPPLWSPNGLFGRWTPADEIVGLRTENSKTFDNHDGTRSVIVAGRLHQRVGPGTWEDLPEDRVLSLATLGDLISSRPSESTLLDDTAHGGSGDRPEACTWCAAFSFFRCQHLYLADELDFAGTIHSLGFYAWESDTDTLGSSHQWLKDVSYQTFTADTWESPGREIWSGNLVVTGNGWNEILLADSLFHDRDSSLLVSYRHTDGTAEPFYDDYLAGNASFSRGKWGGSDSEMLPNMSCQPDRAYIQIVYTPVAARADVQCTQILAPTGAVSRGQPCTPWAIVKNTGSDPVSFPVRFSISDGYVDSASVPALQPGFVDTVSFYTWTPDTAGTFTTKCSTQLAGDANPANDRQIGSVTVQFLDAEARAILAPVGTVDSGSTITPTARVRNNGNTTIIFDAVFRISDGYADTGTANSVAPGESVVVAFGPWTARHSGTFTAKCSTCLAGDMVTSNDRTTDSVRVVTNLHDVQVISILAPTGTVDSGATLNPRATVRNNGSHQETFPVLFEISGGYRDTQIVRNLPADSARTVTFAGWVSCGRETLATKCTTELAGDQVPANDKRTGTVFLQVRDVGLTAILAPSGGLDSGTVIVPRVAVRNYGDVAATFGIRLRIGTSYDSTLNRTLAPGADLEVRFRDWTASPRGAIPVRCTTVYVGDMIPGNNEIVDTVLVGLRDVGVEAILAPVGCINRDSSVMPRASVRDYGSTAESCMVVFVINEGVQAVYCDTNTCWLAPGETCSTGFSAFGPTDTGQYSARCFTCLSGDQRRANDTARAIFAVRRMLLHDVGVTRILEPRDSIREDSVVQPRAEVRNLGRSAETFPVVFRIVRDLIVVYDDTQVVSLEPGDSMVVDSFAPWAASFPATHRVVSQSVLPSDLDTSNDAALLSCVVFRPKVHDAGVEAILAPVGDIDTGTTIIPLAEVKNYGDFSESFFSWFTILNDTGGKVYGQSVWTASLAPGEDTTIELISWTGRSAGSYQARCSTWLASDNDHTNDVRSLGFVVQFPSSWTRMADMPTGPRRRNVKAGGALACLGGGDCKLQIVECNVSDIASNDGVVAHQSPSPRALTLAVGSLYALKGNRTHEFYAYDALGDSWVTTCSIPGPGGVGRGGALTAYGGRIYAVKGGNADEFWCFLPGGDSWHRLANVPTDYWRKMVAGGSCLASVEVASDKWRMSSGERIVASGRFRASFPLYLLKGGTREFYGYDPDTNRWVRCADAPPGRSGRRYRDGSCMVAVRDYVYLIRGFDNEMFAYSSSEDTWYARSPLPANGRSGRRKRAGAGTAIAHDNDVIWLLKGGRSGELWRYCTFGDTWNQFEDLPKGTGRRAVAVGGAIVGISSQLLVNSLRPGSRSPKLPAVSRKLSAVSSLFALKGNNTRELWRYELPAGPSCKLQAEVLPTDGSNEMEGALGEFQMSNIKCQNPVSGATTISFFLPEARNWSLRLYDAAGRIAGNVKGRGTSWQLSGAGLSKGIYFLELNVNGYRIARKLVLE